MKSLLYTLILLCIASAASAYEYHLQYTPPAGGRLYKVVGYGFSGDNVNGYKVFGNCSYSVTSACSGRGCHSTTTYYYNNCKWDLYGNLLSATSGSLPVQSPISTSGTEVVYASSNIQNSCVPT